MGYYGAAMAVWLMKQCGDDLTRENVLRQATHMRGVTVPMLLPGISLNTAPDDYSPIKQMQLQRFDGTGWVKIGGIVGGSAVFRTCMPGESAAQRRNRNCAVETIGGTIARTTADLTPTASASFAPPYRTDNAASRAIGRGREIHRNLHAGIRRPDWR